MPRKLNVDRALGYSLEPDSSTLGQDLNELSNTYTFNPCKIGQVENKFRCAANQAPPVCQSAWSRYSTIEAYTALRVEAKKPHKANLIAKHCVVDPL